MKSFSKRGILHLAILIFFSLSFVSCNFSNVDDRGIQRVNNLFLDQEEVNFFGARLQITGPVSITGPNSHISMLLELSSDENFSNSQPLNTNVLTIQLLLVNEGINFADFSLPRGSFQVFDPSLLNQEYQNDALANQDLLAFPTLSLQYLGNDDFKEVYFGTRGLMNLQFDIQNDLISISHNWETKEGRKMSGLNTLPINLTAFRN